jgi:S-formylglutathione hydrolase FrmB
VALALSLVLGAPAGALANPSSCTYGDPPAPSPRIVSGELDGLAFNVLLPSDYATSGRSYPVLYLLHGADYNENTWLTQSDVQQFTAAFTGADAAIVVMPDGGPQGFYTDWYQGDEQWETYHLRRLVPYIAEQFRVRRGGANRAVAGFSMGGFGALHYAARHPGMFAAAGSFSGINHSTVPEDPYEGAPSAERRAGPGSPGPASGARPRPDYKPPTDAGSGCGPQDGSDFGDRVNDAVVWHGHNPTDVAPDLRGVKLYVSAGAGVPCPDDLTGPPSGLTAAEAAVKQMNVALDSALTDAGVEHTTDFPACGVHNMVGAQRGLHAFWPIMTSAFGRKPATRIASYRSIDPDFAAWGWHFHADPKRALEFLEVDRATRRGFTLTGSGTETVLTPAFYRPGRRYRVNGALPRRPRAGRHGRLRLRVDLGPAHTEKQFSRQESDPAFVLRSVRVRR